MTLLRLQKYPCIREGLNQTSGNATKNIVFDHTSKHIQSPRAEIYTGTFSNSKATEYKTHLHYHTLRSNTLDKPWTASSSRARDVVRGVLTVTVVAASSDIDIGPRPVRAATAAAHDDDVVAAALDRVGPADVLDGQVRDRDAAGGGASVKVTAFVVLLDQDAVSEAW